LRVLLVHNQVPPGAPPDEADVLIQAAAVTAALERGGHAVSQLACGLDLTAVDAAVRRARPDVVFNLVESLAGFGQLIHLVPSVLEALRIPFAGCTADAFYVTSHKVLTKQVLASAGLPTPAWLTDGGAGSPPPAPARWIVKSVWEDASLGMDDGAVIDGGPERVREELARRADRPGAPWFAEEYIDGREFNIALLDGPSGPTVLPHAEMLFHDFPADKPRIVGYAAKWREDSFEYTNTRRTFATADADAPLLEEMTRLSLACWKLLGLRGWARVDFRVDAAGRPWILEANVNPCLAPDAGYAAALAQAGIPFDAAVERILAAAG
jgi:D-alanine-D-alanine ligase